MHIDKEYVPAIFRVYIHGEGSLDTTYLGSGKDHIFVFSLFLQGNSANNSIKSG